MASLNFERLWLLNASDLVLALILTYISITIFLQVNSQKIHRNNHKMTGTKLKLVNRLHYSPTGTREAVLVMSEPIHPFLNCFFKHCKLEKIMEIQVPVRVKLYSTYLGCCLVKFVNLVNNNHYLCKNAVFILVYTQWMYSEFWTLLVKYFVHGCIYILSIY